MYGFCGELLVLGMVNCFLTFLFSLRNRPSKRDIETSTSSSHRSHPNIKLGAIRAWFRANLVLPAAFGTKHQQLV
jgi:hypothetical protein